MDGQHVRRIRRAPHERRDAEGRKHQQESTERELELLPGERADILRRQLLRRQLGLAQLPHVGTGVMPGDEQFDDDAERKREESPAGADPADSREKRRAGERHANARERRRIRLAALVVVEEDDHRHVPEEERRLHHQPEE